MKKFLSFFTLFLTLQLMAQDYNFTIGSKHYKLVKSMKDWTSAAAFAVQDGGYLVEINSAAEQNGIWSAIQASGISMTYTSVNDGGGVAYIWIGATDKNQEGHWLWDGDNDGQGQNFFTGQGAWGAGNGAVVNGAYVNWGGANTGTFNEPDDYGSSQDAAAIGLEPWPVAGAGNNAGEWNDINISNTLYFIIEYDATGFNDNPENNLPKLDVYRNGNNSITVKANREMQELAVYAVDGRRVYFREHVNADEITISSIRTSGVYFVRSRFVDSAVLTRKVIIN